MSNAADGNAGRLQCGVLVAELAAALARGDDKAFSETLDSLCIARESVLRDELRRLTADLQCALDRFSVDSRLVDLAAKDVPDARHRLEHVLRLTDDAAHKTMDLVEQSCPNLEAVTRDVVALLATEHLSRIPEDQFRASLQLTKQRIDTVRGNLSEVLLAQGYQDLSGQIIRGVMKLVGELESALQDLVRLSGVEARSPISTADNARGHGPAIPGVNNGPSVSGQSDVDSLLADLGM